MYLALFAMNNLAYIYSILGGEHDFEWYAIWSVLFVQVNAACFPSECWYDATSAVLSIWQQNMIRLLDGTADCVQLPFMDGDYEIVLTRLKQESVSAKLIESDTLIIWEDELDVRYFAKQLLSATGKLRAYYASNAESPQMKELSSLADKLRVTLKKTLVN